ncbi:NAD-dependent epimerase/dehydratase family protein [Pannonibacter indicus]|nr:NAD-dependent epimerase/dehydratase family protein [Pannonibacter indicus]
MPSPGEAASLVHMDVFLTGATGLIGSAILRRLRQDGRRVAALARSSASAEEIDSLGAIPVPGDLEEPETWIHSALSCKGIIHAAGGPAAAERHFAAVMRQACLQAAAPPRLVYTGGIWLFPPSGEAVLSESTAFEPLPAFGHLAEIIRSLQNVQRMGVAVIHPALVCGPDAGPLAEMAAAACSSEPFRTKATEDTLWPLVDADDLAELYLLALDSPQFRLSLFGAGIGSARVGEIAGLVGEACGAPVTLEALSGTPEDPRLDWQAGYGRSQTVSPARAVKMLGWEPKRTSLESLVSIAAGPLPSPLPRRETSGPGTG